MRTICMPSELVNDASVVRGASSADPRVQKHHPQLAARQAAIARNTGT